MPGHRRPQQTPISVLSTNVTKPLLNDGRRPNFPAWHSRSDEHWAHICFQALIPFTFLLEMCLPVKLAFIFHSCLLPSGAVVKNPSAEVVDVGSIPGLGRSPWSRKWQLTPAYLPRKFHGQSSLVGYSPGVAKSWTQLSDWAQAPHSSTLWAQKATSFIKPFLTSPFSPFPKNGEEGAWYYFSASWIPRSFLLALSHHIFKIIFMYIFYIHKYNCF